MNDQTVTLKVTGSAGWWLSSAAETLSIEISWKESLVTIKTEDLDKLIQHSRIKPEGWSRRSGAAARVDGLLSRAAQ